ncbi:C4-dicarboxylate ABC transporter substrate-binding protein [Acidovorax sp. SRB_14]|uniref:TAXI family TRAP transporter solute-binding subunit n=1 Tax=unclassified Acidovorax TaxID=2684926 RepID=UPI00145E4939|nr:MULTISPECIES: TAXI family TRAP transporter solute-binding subunit [unclassified Acidovorax]NMM77485.1 C4-dicarboxylate ABC transporter substrate-binding protein [Acidovorax sp. SRB_24]NMM82322.1 C4-dicarboxylate ABC transporter substrate-binding protein [Acidovorax sp. SRB_14]NMM90324.1 C4-dicarboxylate ABC transporter substrate-binding protein [Rhodococcus sp. SRB_17]
MPQAFRNTLLSLRDLLISAGPLAFLAVGLLALAYAWLKPTPPKQVTLATGPAQSAYEEFGKRYQKALAADGIRVVLLPSEGSSANLQLLREGRADLAFVQGGTAELQASDREGLSSLGSLFVEPLWLFYREDAARQRNRSGRLDALPQLRGLRVNVGTAGSGVPTLVEKLLAANRIAPTDLRLSQLGQTPATVGFLAGKLDVLVFASAPEAPMVQMLLQTPGVQLMDFPQHEAYGRRFAFLSPVTLPRGVVDLAGDVPPADVRLVASTTALLAQGGTHPALLQLFAQAGQALHSGAGWFNRAREFPNTRLSELPMAPEADRAINEPVPLLQRYLPFWIANLIERMWLVLGILLAALLPLSRIVPPLYQFRVRSRVFRWYGRLREIETDMESGQLPMAALSQALDQLEAQVEKVSVPLSYADELYALRNHIQLVRQRLPPA